MYKPVIASLDGSAFAEEALPYVKRIAQATGAEIQLNRVVSSKDEVTGASNYLSGIGRRLGEHVSINVHQGDVAQAITDQIKAQPNGLAVMTTHGRTGLSEAVLGSVALAVVKAAGKPVLVYRPRGGPAADVQIGSVAVALDGTAFPEAILPEAIQLALDLKVKLTLLQAVPIAKKAIRRTPTGDELAQLGDADLGSGDVLESSYLSGMAHEIASQHKLEVDWEVLHGNPAGAICEYVHDTKDVILAITAHARPALKRVIFGSVTASCIRNAGVPILVYWQQ